MEELKFTFKGRGDKIYNDVPCPDLFELGNNSFEFILMPKSKFWRFGIRLMRNQSAILDRYRDQRVKHIEIAAGEYNEKQGWHHSNFLFLQEYFFKGEGQGGVLTSWQTYISLAKVYISVLTDEDDNAIVSVSSDECPLFSARLPVRGYMYFKLFAWADTMDFEVDTTIRVLNSDETTKDRRINTLWDKISESNLSKAAFLIPRTNDTSITVSVKGSFSNFYVNLQDNKEYFTIRRNPAPSDGAYFVTDIRSWSDVMKKFELWMHDIRKEVEKTLVTDFNRAKGVLLIEGAVNYSYRNDGVKPSLNVETQAEIFLKLLKAISTAPNESGLLLGVFGKWGRGKTFFWNQIVKKLLTKGQTHFDHLEFHAWKYQDTPASWAYLYETFAKKFYSIEHRILWIIRVKFWNRIKLNLERLGAPRFYGTIALIVFGAVWYFVLSFAFKLKLILNIVSAIGLSALVSGILFYNAFSGLAKDFFKSYFTEVSFKGLLGIQAEIQKELVILLKAWIPDQDLGKKRLILFVDDIDRCDESRIIEVVDSLKVMIDNPEISSRVIVIAAIDEVVLKRAVKQKYYNLISKDLSLLDEEKASELENISREYIDKLFITGFKLSSLTKSERIKLFADFTEKQIFYRGGEGESGIQHSPIEHKIETDNKKSNSEGGGKPDAVSAYDDYIAFQPNSKFELMDYEVDSLKKALLKFKDITPRSMRIFYYRYLLAKEFMELIIGEKTSSLSMEWHINHQQKILLSYLMVEYSKEKTQADLLNAIKNIEDGDAKGDKTLKVDCLNEKFTISKDLYLSLLKIVETVVPY